jgi:hypothetical protein
MLKEQNKLKPKTQNDTDAKLTKAEIKELADITTNFTHY